MPPELLAHARRRHPGAAPRPALLPAHPGRPGSPYLLFGSDRAATRAQLAEFFSAADVAADEAHAGRDRPRCATTSRRPGCRSRCPSRRPPSGTSARRCAQVFIDLVRGSVADYLARFGFKSELLVSMYAVTDGLSGLNAGPDDPGTGHNFLVHNMCRLPGSDGTWMIAEGGMGTVSRTFADAARAAGATILTGTPVHAVDRGRRRGQRRGAGRRRRGRAPGWCSAPATRTG